MSRRLLFAAPMLAASVVARAQMLPPDQTLVPFTRYVAVRERMLMGYDATGIRVGGFNLRPAVDVSTNYNDNAFANDEYSRIPQPRIVDGYLSVAPSAQLQSNFSTGSVSINASGEIDRFFTYPSENTESVNTSVYGTKDIGASTRVRGIVRYDQERESRESQNAFAPTDRRIRFETETGAVGISHTFSNVLVSGSAGVTRAHYFNGTIKGVMFDQQYRNDDNFELRLRTEVAQSQALSYFAQVTRDATSYDPDRALGFARESKNYEVLGGVRFELPVLARGEIGIGYLNSSYRDARFRTFSGLAIDGRLMFFPSQLTTVTLTGRRSVSDAGVVQAASYIALTGGVRVDHELLRTLILGAGVDLERDTFNGFDRRDGRLTIDATADWRFTPRLWLRTRYDRAGVSSDGVDRYKSFVRNRVTIGVGFRI